MCKLKQGMSSGYRFDRSVSKVIEQDRKTQPPLFDCHVMKRGPGCLKKLQNFEDILINHNININNILDATARFTSEIDSNLGFIVIFPYNFWWLSFPFLGSCHTNYQRSTSLNSKT